MFIPGRIGAVPAIENDECLSSFLIRTAKRHGLSPHSFCHILWPSYSFWTRDLDRCSNPSLIDDIANRTGKSHANIENLTLRPLMQMMTGHVRRHGICRSILPIGIYHRDRHAHGQRYCPDCLAQTPHYAQRAWRVSYVNVCSVHRRYLYDACPQCDKPFIAHRHDSLLSARCFECRADLRSAPYLQMNRNVVECQQYLASLLTEGVSCADQFRGWHALLSLLARKEKQFSSQHGDWTLWRQQERNQLFSVAFELHQDWPTTFLDWAADNGVSQAGIAEYDCAGTWLMSGVNLLPERYAPRCKRRKSVASRRSRAGGGRCSDARSARARQMLDAAYRFMSKQSRRQA